ncbi:MULTISPECIES: hypothetical protein [Paraburkholderia]|uniref:hypothetical protein n=1 Tax=Paraburkholderia TaxID=1822464 RepID=UPI0022536E7E|nr:MULTISPECIES: hypothetical protein [Paraburkholderia]MCX4177743.1 hypothetical protein [Paraburkholderia madseniana]MDQ6465730.1 hypothetical protein [Paraburkholderia madseniana]
MDILNWVESHWEWLFGGVGGTAVVAFLGWLFTRSNGDSQKQSGGADSINVQAGRDAIVKDASNQKRRR